MAKKYKVSDISTTLGVSIRTAQRYVENLTNKEKKETIFNKDVFDLIILRHHNDNIATDNDSELITQEFKQDEYDLLQEIIHKYPVLKEQLDFSNNQIKYLQEALKQQQDMHEKLIITIQSRNLIDYTKSTSENPPTKFDYE